MCVSTSHCHIKTRVPIQFNMQGGQFRGIWHFIGEDFYVYSRFCPINKLLNLTWHLVSSAASDMVTFFGKGFSSIIEMNELFLSDPTMQRELNHFLFFKSMHCCCIPEDSCVTSRNRRCHSLLQRCQLPAKVRLFFVTNTPFLGLLSYDCGIKVKIQGIFSLYSNKYCVCQIAQLGLGLELSDTIQTDTFYSS